MKLREATLNDLDVLSGMNIQLRADEQIDNFMTDDEVKVRMKGFLEQNEYKVFILEDNDFVCGYALINIKRYPLYLRQLYIDSMFRNKGVGSFFMKQLMESLNINDLDVDVMVWNNKAINFYEKFGFRKRYIGLRYHKE